MYKLHICIPARDRTYLTSKCIESIWKNTKIFNEINVYLFDNKSDITPTRMSIISNLINEQKLQYYSYDTNSSTYNCFSKAVIFQRWIKMMKSLKAVDNQNHINNDNTFYLLMDNDMILGEFWDEYFISAYKSINVFEKDLHFLIKYPGGVPLKCRDNQPIHVIRNVFRKDNFFNVQMGIGGGASGIWFMDYNMINKVMWDDKDLGRVYGMNKRHDSTTWELIRLKNGHGIRYNAAIMPPEDNPLILHLGGRIGSICNLLTKDKYDQEKNNLIIEEENEIMNLSIDELWDKYKDTAKDW